MMRRIRLANAFLYAGLVVGLVTAAALAFDVVPRLSPFMMKVVIYKLAFIGAAVLLAAGAILRRWARRDAQGEGGERVGPGPS
jgi:hypothetical protein